MKKKIVGCGVCGTKQKRNIVGKYNFNVLYCTNTIIMCAIIIYSLQL